MSAAPAARFVRTYTTASGRSFRVYVADDGRRVDVKVRDGRGEPVKLTGREARLVAESKLAGSPSVWRVVCDDHATPVAPFEDAVELCDEIVTLGACCNAHTVERAVD